MKLLGRDISADTLLEKVQARLKARGLSSAPLGEPMPSEVEPRVDPWAFNLEALTEHADSARPLPLETHRAGLGRAVLLAKWAFRKSCQVLINETLARQGVFNGHVRDSYAELSAEVERLRAKVAALEAEREAPPVPVPTIAASKPKRPSKKPESNKPRRNSCSATSASCTNTARCSGA